MSNILILDTNSCDNVDLNVFLGNRDEIKKFINDGFQILLPQIVLEEIKQHKLEKYRKELKQYIENYFFDFDKDNYARKQEKEILNRIETIISNDKDEIYTDILYTKDKNKFYDTMLDKVIRKEPPFENKSDKGFKDAIVAWNVLEYTNTYECLVHLLTKDKRLGQFFIDNNRVRVIESYDDYKKICKEENDFSIKPVELEKILNRPVRDILKGYYSINNDYIVIINTECYIRIDMLTKTVIDKVNEDVEKIVTDLIESTSFKNTHELIGCINEKKLINFFSKKDIERIYEGASKNTQIYFISNDNDVFTFFKNIFDNYRQFVDHELERKLYSQLGYEINEKGEITFY